MTKWEAIINLHCAGRKNLEIIKLLKVAKSTVYNVVKIFKELGTSEDRPRSGRPRTTRTKKVIEAVQERVRRNPKRSARQMAKDINVSVTSMRTIVKNDIQLSLYKIRKKNLERTWFHLGELKAGTAQKDFSDEKLFAIEATVNYQND